MNHCLGEADPLKHSLGIAPDAAIPRLGETDEVEELGGACLEFASSKTAELPVEGDRFRTGEKFIKVGILWQETDIDATGDARTRHSEDFRGARGGGDQTEQDLQRGALA